MVIVTILTFFCLLSAFITFGLGIYVYAKNPEARASRIFLAAMLTACYWALGEFFIWESTTYEGALFWLNFSALWPFLAVLATHFILAFTKHPLMSRKNHYFLLPLLYLPAILLSSLEFLTTKVYDIVFEAGRWVYKPVLAEPYYPASAFFVTIIMLWSIYLITKAWYNAADEMARRQNRLVSIGLYHAVGFGIISGIVLPVFGVSIPNLIFIGIVLFSLCISVAILRYGLFILTPETAVPDILETMSDAMILADKDGTILSANSAAYELFEIAPGSLPGLLLTTILPEKVYTTILSGETDGKIPDLEAFLEKNGSSPIF